MGLKESVISRTVVLLLFRTIQFLERSFGKVDLLALGLVVSSRFVNGELLATFFVGCVFCTFTKPTLSESLVVSTLRGLL